MSTSPFIHGRPLDIDLPLHVTEIEMGPPSGATFLMLHGFGASSFTWRHWAPKLAKRGRVLCVDYKGFGAAPKPSSDSYELADQAKTVVQLVDQALDEGVDTDTTELQEDQKESFREGGSVVISIADCGSCADCEVQGRCVDVNVL